MSSFLQTWDRENPVEFSHVDSHTSTTEKNIGGGVVIGVDGVQSIAKGGKYKAYFHTSKPGVQALYYATTGSKIAIGNRLHEVRAAGLGTAQKVADGVVHVFGKDGLKKYRGDTIAIPTAIYQHATPHDAAEKLWNLLLEAAEDTYNLLGRPKIVTPISGGTDGLLTAMALKEIGADQTTVCVGTSSESFDPFHAAIYAKQLGLDYTYLPLPTTDASLIHLRDRAIRAFEASDFSNVLMAMCFKVVADHAINAGATGVYTADYADVVLGNDILSTGKFNKLIREGKMADTDLAWAKYRIETLLHTLPTTVMCGKVFEDQGLTSRQIFYTRPVLNFLLSQSRELTPAATDKRLYKAILNTWVPDGVWNTKRKVGFYTGAGIGAIRLKNPILQDLAIRDAYQRIFKDQS